MRVAESAGTGSDQLFDADPGDPTTVLRRARGGDEAAFRALYRLLTPSLVSYASVLVDRDPEQVVAQCWPRIVQELVRFEGDGLEFRRYALTVTRAQARRLPRDRRRRVRRLRPGVPSGSAPSAERPVDPSAAVGAGTGGEIMALIAALPSPQAEAVALRAIVGLDTHSAAQIVGKRPKQLQMTFGRGMRNLARLLEHQDNGGERP